MARKEPTLGNLDDVQGTWPAPPARPEPDKAAPAAAIPEAVRPARADAPSQPRLAPAQPKLAQPSSTPSEGRRTLPGGAPITTDAGAATPVGTTPARPTNQKYRETTPRTLASAPVVAAMASAANTAQKEGEPSAHAHKPVRATVFGWHGRLRRIPFMVQSAAGILIALVLVLPSYQLMQQALAGIQIMHALGVAVLAIAALVFLISASMRRIHDLGMPRLVAIDSAGKSTRSERDGDTARSAIREPLWPAHAAQLLVHMASVLIVGPGAHRVDTGSGDIVRE